MVQAFTTHMNIVDFQGFKSVIKRNRDELIINKSNISLKFFFRFVALFFFLFLFLN